MPEWRIEPEMSYGSPASVILEKADLWKPDLVVTGSHGRTAAGRFFFGSVSQKLVHEAHCSVRIARGSEKPSSEPVRLIIGIDGSKGAQSAVDVVAARHWPAGTEVRLVNACWKIPPTTSQHMLTEIAHWIEDENARVKAMADAAFTKLKEAGLHPSVAIKEEEPRILLLNEAESWKADCIFVGARGMGRIERFLIGSVSSAIAARADCSVEVIRPK
jgi:nucleotide-binding universal stress UspA family protein